MSFENFKVLVIQLKQDKSLLFIQKDLNEIEIRIIRSTPERIINGEEYNFAICEKIKQSRVQVDELYHAARKLFPHLKVEKFSTTYIPSENYSYCPPTWYNQIAVFMRGLMEVYCGLCPEIPGYHIDYAYRCTENIAGEKLIILNRENINCVISSLEKLEEINLSFFTFFSILTDCLSDGTFKLKNILPDKVIEKVKVKDTDTFYLYPQSVSLLEKKYSKEQYLELAHKARIIYIPPLLEKPVLRKILEIFPRPEDVFKLMQKASTGGLLIDSVIFSDEVHTRSEIEFSWTLLYAFNGIAQYLVEAKKKQSNVTLEGVMYFYDIDLSSKEIKNMLRGGVDVYQKYIRTVETIENFNRVEKEIIITVTQIRLLDVINLRELNLVFLDRLKTILEKDKDKILSTEIADLITSSKSLHAGISMMFTSLEKEDLPLVEKLFSLFQGTSLPSMTFLFYPHIKESKFYERIVNSVINNKKRMLDYYTTYEYVYEETNQQKKEFLKEIKSDIEEKLKPGTAFYLAKNGFSSDKIVEKSKAFALVKEEYKEVYLKAECFNLCKTKSFNGVARKFLKHFFGDHFVNIFYVEDFIYLGKRMAEILDDEEFKAMTEFLKIAFSRNSNYICTNISSKSISQLWQKIKPQKFLSALRKVVVKT